MQRSNSVMPTQTLFYGQHDPSLSQSLLPCSNSVLTIWALFSGHRDFSLSQSLLQSSESVLTIQALQNGPCRLLLWADCNRTCRLKAEETCSHSHQCPARPWSSLAMPRCQRSSWPLFGARAEERVGQQKSVAKTQKNESFRKQDGTNLKDSHSKTS